MQGLLRGTIGMTGALAIAIGCGGKVVEGADDASTPAPGPTTTSSVAPTSTGTSTPPSRPDGGPTPIDAAPPAVDAGPGPKPAVDCSALKATGTPSGCGAEAACPAIEPYPGYAEELLSCLVDKCLSELGRGPWCGTILLGLDAEGCTSEYLESSSASGCVKYQGYFQRWPCAVDRKITVTRSCGG